MQFMHARDPQEVLSLISDHFSPLPAERVELEKAGGRVIADSITSPEDTPAFNRSTVDGYALSARDTFGASESSPALLEQVGEVLMGEVAPDIADGQCCLVHTGGMIPLKADAVLMVEDSDSTGNTIQCFRQVAPGENVIHRGEDIASGATVLEAGTVLRSPEIGVLASLGITTIKARAKPQVGLFSSGNELIDYHSASLPPGRIRDSNAPALLHFASQMGAEARYGGILEDSLDAFLSAGKKMLEKVDLLVFTGGSSVGSRDYTAQAMDQLGAPGLIVEGISVQPGKPTLIANCDGKPVLGLPGHPVSALIIFSLFGRAIIDRLAGRPSERSKPTVRARLARNIASRTGRTDYVRIKLKAEPDGLQAWPVFGRSGMLRTLADADGLLEIPAPIEGISAGEEIEIRIWE